jgi:hypothetical protein
MRLACLKRVLPAAILMLHLCLAGQNNLPAAPAQSEQDEYKQKLEQLIKYLEGTLNFLGDSLSSPREKEIIINQSYLKIFKDDKVVIEDDLDEKRDITIRKEIQGYLKDIDFFFTYARFEFTITDISTFTNGDKKTWFKVTMNRLLTGTTVSGDQVSSNRIRYVEVNLDAAKNDLKIASIYTSGISEWEDLKNWWNEMGGEWKQVFGKGLFVGDSVPLAAIVEIGDTYILTKKKGDETNPDTLFMPMNPLMEMLKGMTRREEIDVTGNIQIASLTPLIKLTGLKRVGCSSTLVSSLGPLSYLNDLERLNCAHTLVDDLEPLRYSSLLSALDLSYTFVSNPEPISQLRRLEKLNLGKTSLEALGYLSSLSNLKELDISQCNVRALDDLSGLINLETLDFSSNPVPSLAPLASLINLVSLGFENTVVEDLSPLSGLSRLTLLIINGSAVRSLKPLEGLVSLKKIYCDNTGVTKEEAREFMTKRPDCLVIFESDQLLTWWSVLDKEWKQVFSGFIGGTENPGKEQLHELVKIRKIDISGQTAIKSVDALNMLGDLTDIDLSSTGVTDLSPLRRLKEVTRLNVSRTKIGDLSPLEGMYALKELNADHTLITTLPSLPGLKSLQTVYADNTGLTREAVSSFLQKHPGCLVVYRTTDLKAWWSGLPPAWQNLLSSRVNATVPPDRTALHRIAGLESLNIPGEKDILNLYPITQLTELKELTFTDTYIDNLAPLSDLNKLETLVFSRNPVSDLAPLAGLTGLKRLEFENTPVEDLGPLAGLVNLEALNCAGTQIRNLKPLENLKKMKSLDVFSTRISSLKPLLKLGSLKTLRCYNTKLNKGRVNEFREANPGCEVVYY